MKLYFVIAFLGIAYAFPEQGKWELSLKQTNHTRSISKTMFKDTKVLIDASNLCSQASTIMTYKVDVLMVNVVCYHVTVGMPCLIMPENVTLNFECLCSSSLPGVEKIGFKVTSGFINCSDLSYTQDKAVDSKLRYSTDKDCGVVEDKQTEGDKDTQTEGDKDTQTEGDKDTQTEGDKGKQTEGDKDKQTEGDKDKQTEGDKDTQTEGDKDTQPEGNNGTLTASPKGQSRRKRDEDGTTKDKKNRGHGKVKGKKKQQKESKTESPTGAVKKEDKEDAIISSWKDGQYTVYISVEPVRVEGQKEEPKPAPSDKDTGYTVIVDTRDTRGKLLSAADFPYLYFYLIMTILYVLYGFGWLLMMACYWRDLLRIQYFILIVIILGFIEKVFYYSEYAHVDTHGESSKTMVIVAELVAVAKRTLARALVVVVSVGFGLVKPRLGPTLHKLLAVCFIYFVLASVESCLRATQMTQETDNSRRSQLFALIPLALCETGIMYWVFSSLLQTIRTLRLRRNVAKLSLYRHFTNLLIFSVFVSVVYLIWSLVRIQMVDCIRDIREIWLRQGFWPMLFSVVLLVIMILWRPSINNQRYSHSLLLENEDGEDEEDTLMGSEAFEAKKRTQVNGKSSAKDKRKTREEKVEDDLQWIEDNIPASVADSALQPVLNDSEEEIMTTRFELSKMD